MSYTTEDLNKRGIRFTAGRFQPIILGGADFTGNVYCWIPINHNREEDNVQVEQFMGKHNAIRWCLDNYESADWAVLDIESGQVCASKGDPDEGSDAVRG